MQKIGHRGAKGYVAENTLASFQKALDFNVDAIELDVHLSSDGQIMVIHDETIDRTSSKTGFVYELHSFYLKELGVPTLEDVLILVNKKCIINIEIKVATATQKVLQVIEKYVKEQDWQYNQFQFLVLCGKH
jgi:glycerophosphoryl diester phosphodiesterase